MSTAANYKGYKLIARDNRERPIAVFDPRYPRYPRNSALYEATTLSDAKRWVNAYRNGIALAVLEKARGATP